MIYLLLDGPLNGTYNPESIALDNGYVHDDETSAAWLGQLVMVHQDALNDQDD